MTTPAIDQPVDLTDDDVYYPESDGQPMGETGIHALAILRLLDSLRNLYELLRKRTDVYVIADMFLYYERGNPKAQKSPDVMVIIGVNATPERRTFRTWVENAVPTVIFEVTSLSSVSEDMVRKRTVYEQIGVKEYFIFDPLSEHLPEPSWRGLRLHNRQYVEMTLESDGGYISQEMNVKLLQEGYYVRVIDLETGEPIPWPKEMALKALEAVSHAEEVQRQADEAQRQLEEVRQQAEEAQRHAEEIRRQADQMAAENERLRTLLKKYQPDENKP